MPFPKLAEVQATLGDNAAPPPAPEASASTAVDAASATESPTPDPLSDPPEPASPDGSSSESTAEAKADAPGPIPYDRFKQKNEEAKHLKDLNGTLQERVKQLEASQQAPQVEPEPKETSEFLGKIKDLAERAGDEDVAGALVAMGEQLEAIRAQSETVHQDTQQMQIQKLVDDYNRKIGSALESSSISDKKAARHYILQVLNQNPDADIGSTVNTFVEHERKLEDDVLKRLGVTRPEAKQETASAPDPASSLPLRGKTSAGTAPVADGASTPSNKSMTLREMKASLFKGRRRPR